MDFKAHILWSQIVDKMFDSSRCFVVSLSSLRCFIPSSRPPIFLISPFPRVTSLLRPVVSSPRCHRFLVSICHWTLGSQKQTRSKNVTKKLWKNNIYHSVNMCNELTSLSLSSKCSFSWLKMSWTLWRRYWFSISKFRFPRRPWDEHDCEGNAGLHLCKNKNKHR